MYLQLEEMKPRNTGHWNSTGIKVLTLFLDLSAADPRLLPEQCRPLNISKDNAKGLGALIGWSGPSPAPQATPFLSPSVKPQSDLPEYHLVPSQRRKLKCTGLGETVYIWIQILWRSQSSLPTNSKGTVWMVPRPVRVLRGGGKAARHFPVLEVPGDHSGLWC